MRFVLGVVLGVALCSVFPQLPQATQRVINDLAHTAAEATEATAWESAEEALTDWRSQ